MSKKRFLKIYEKYQTVDLLLEIYCNGRRLIDVFNRVSAVKWQGGNIAITGFGNQTFHYHVAEKIVYPEDFWRFLND